MKKKVIIFIYCCSLFVITFYIPSIEWYTQNGELEQDSKLQSCSIDHHLCANFKAIIRGFLFGSLYYSGYLSIKNNRTGQYAQINNFLIGFDDYSLIPTQLIWKNNNQLDVYLGENGTKNTSNFFFKNLGNVTVFLHKD